MTTSIEELTQQLSSPDRDTRALALGELIAQGEAAVPALLSALRSENDKTRELAAEGLAEIATPSTAESLVAALGDRNGVVRAYAARALSRIGDPRAIDALVQTINDFPDIMHSQYSLSTYTLMTQGPEVLPSVAPLLKAPEPQRRERAFIIIQAIVTKWLLPGTTTWESLWQSLGRYDPYAPAEERDQAADQWTTWIEQNVETTPNNPQP